MLLCTEAAVANTGLYANQLAPGYVRLFCIEQPSGRCSFETHALDQAPKYMCVSYTWGPPESTVYADEGVATNDGVPIYLNASSKGIWVDKACDKVEDDADDDGAIFILEVDGLFYRVSRNLHDLVTRLIDGGTREPLWIDALSINQADLVERSAQVSMMGDIFRSSTSVQVWLGGDERGEADTVVRMCRAIQDELSRQLDGASPMAEVSRMPNFYEPDLFESLGCRRVRTTRGRCLRASGIVAGSTAHGSSRRSR